MVQALSDREFILQRVVHLLTSSADVSNTSNLILQLTLTELVKQVMRELAQDEASDLRQGIKATHLEPSAQCSFCHKRVQG